MKLTVFSYIRNPNAHHKVIGKNTLRVINVHPSFCGITSKGDVLQEEFKKLADALEPSNEGFTIQ